MAYVTWTGASGDHLFSTAGNWSGDAVPGVLDSIFIDDPTGTVFIGDTGGNEPSGDEVVDAHLYTSLQASGQFAVDGELYVGANAELTCTGDFLAGDVINSGRIYLTATATWQALNCVLSGSGVLVLAGATVDNTIGDAGITAENSGSTIEGFGIFDSGGGGIAITNDIRSQIIAEGGTLTLDSGQTLSNGGLLEAVAASILVLKNDVSNALGSNGTVLATGKNAFVDLDGTTITDGTLRASDGGLIRVGDGDASMASATITGLTLAADLQVGRNHTLHIGAGTLVDADIIDVGNGSIGLQGNVEISGSGRIRLATSASQSGTIFGSDGMTFTNAVTIDGTGSIDGGNVALVNDHTIDADINNGSIELYLASGNNNYNSGLLEATQGGKMFVEPSLSGGANFTNIGSVEAFAGSAISIGTNVILTSLSGSILTGGKWEADGSNATLSIAERFTIDAADIVLDGAGSIVDDDGKALESELTGIGAGGTLAILGSRNYTTTNGVTVKGTLDISGAGTFKSGKLTAAAGSILEGSGTFATSLVTNGAILATGGKLDFGGAVSGSGQGTIENGAALVFGAVATMTVTFGKGGGRLALQDPTQFSGSIEQFGAGDFVDVSHLGAGTSFTYAKNAKNTGGTLTLKHGRTIDKLTLIGSYLASGFKLTSGASGDTIVTFSPPAKSQVAKSNPAPHAEISMLAQSLFDAAFAQGGTLDRIDPVLEGAFSKTPLSAGYAMPESHGYF